MIRPFLPIWMSFKWICRKNYQTWHWWRNQSKIVCLWENPKSPCQQFWSANLDMSTAILVGQLQHVNNNFGPQTWPCQRQFWSANLNNNLIQADTNINVNKNCCQQNLAPDVPTQLQLNRDTDVRLRDFRKTPYLHGYKGYLQ